MDTCKRFIGLRISSSVEPESRPQEETTMPDEADKPAPFRMPLSLMDCYAGKQQVEIMTSEQDGTNEPLLYLQFVEGCGYDVYRLTMEEAFNIAEALRIAATTAIRNMP
jgi:hypothetical protein